MIWALSLRQNVAVTLLIAFTRSHATGWRVWERSEEKPWAFAKHSLSSKAPCKRGAQAGTAEEREDGSPQGRDTTWLGSRQPAANAARPQMMSKPCYNSHVMSLQDVTTWTGISVNNQTKTP